MNRNIFLSLGLAVAMNLAADVEVIVTPQNEQNIEVGIRRRCSKEVLDEKERRFEEERNQPQEIVVEMPQGALSSQLDLGASAKVISLPYDYYAYAGYDHFAMYFSDDCKIVQIEDESQWKVAGYDVYKTLNWATGDLLAIYPNKAWFSVYDYQIVNRTTGEAVEAKLYKIPMIGSPYTKYVTGVDTYYDMVYLSDGSRWELSWSDSSKIRSWLVGDMIIVGMNDGWSSGSYPAILINVNMDEYVYVRFK